MELTGVRVVPVPATIDAAGAARLYSDLSAAQGDPSVRAIVLEGSVAEFCRGMDIAGIGHASAPELEAHIRTFATVQLLLAESHTPTVAVLRGPALGGGLGLAAACNMVVAARSATCGLPEGLLGLTPAVIAPALLGRLTAQQFKRLALLAEPITADDAKLLGLVDEVVEDEAVSARLRRVCVAITRVHPGTARGITEAIRQSTSGSVAAALKWGVAETSRAATSPEALERIDRLLEGEAPWLTR